MKSYQRIIRDNHENNKYHNLFQQSLYPEDVKISDGTVKQCSYKDAKNIIIKYEWLRSMPHRFGYRVSHGIYFGKTMGGALVYAQPQVRSLGLFNIDFGTKSIIQLSRGACAFWTPSCTASYLISKSIKILKNEGITAIVAYCTPEAGEIGTIYQASNFIYYGKTNPSYEYFIDNRWIGERSFAHKKKWLLNQTGEIREQYEKNFNKIKKREVLPRYKYIKILNHKARKNFQHEILSYPKRNAVQDSRENHSVTIGESLGQFQSTAQASR